MALLYSSITALTSEFDRGRRLWSEKRLSGEEVGDALCENSGETECESASVCIVSSEVVEPFDDEDEVVLVGEDMIKVRGP